MSGDKNIVRGPIPPTGVGGIIYSVTLGNGYVVTNPEGFGNGEQTPDRAASVSPPPQGDRSGKPYPLSGRK